MNPNHTRPHWPFLPSPSRLLTLPRTLRRLLPLVFVTLAFSLPAHAWTTVPVPAMPGNAPGQVSGIAFAHGRFVTIADHRIFHSEDGVAWTPTGISQLGLRNLRAVNGRFYAGTDTKIYAGEYGVLWGEVGSLPLGTPEPGETQARSMIWATDGTGGLAIRGRAVTRDGTFYAVIDMFRSDDLVNWTPSTRLPLTSATSGETPQSLAYGSGRYVINYMVSDLSDGIGPSSSVTACTTDGGRTWTRANGIDTNQPVRLAHGNGWFLAVTSDGTMLRSSDGVNFIRTNPNLPTNYNPNVAFNGGLFLTTGSVGIQPAAIYGSVNGSDWANLGSPLPRINWLGGAAYGKGKFVAYGVGNAGTVQPSQPFLATLTRAAPPVIRTQPVGGRIAATRRLRLGTTLEDTAGVTYRWMKNGVVMPGQTAAMLTFDRIAPADAGVYRLLATNATGTVGSDEVTVTVIDPSQGGRLVNLSVNTPVSAGQDPVNVGFVVRGQAPAKPVIIRGIGPGLAGLDVPDFHPDPFLTLVRQNGPHWSNDNWTGTDGRHLGAFPLQPGSKDSAIAQELSPGVYSVLVQGANNTAAGRVLTELYDNNPDDGETLLANLSARAHLPHQGILVVGFVVEGTTPLPVVIRGIGPTLAEHGIANPLPNPHLHLFRGHTKIAENDFWHDYDGRDLGAFPLPVGSADAVISITLQPGVYTAHLNSEFPAFLSGTALIEIYDAQ